MFGVDGDEKKQGQDLLAELIVGKNFQKVFNLNKGSIPARVDVGPDDFDTCAHTSAQDMSTSSSAGSLLPSYAHGMALRGAQAGAITDAVDSALQLGHVFGRSREDAGRPVANSL